MKHMTLSTLILAMTLFVISCGDETSNSSENNTAETEEVESSNMNQETKAAGTAAENPETTESKWEDDTEKSSSESKWSDEESGAGSDAKWD